MIRSMTGFGRSEMIDETKKIIVELKSVNHRYADISMKMPRKLNKYEAQIRKTLAEYIGRGKVDVYITFEDLSDSGVVVRYNKDIAAEYIKYLNEMGNDFGMTEDIKPTVIGRYPDVFEIEDKVQEVDEEQYKDLDTVIRQACTKFVETREIEGENLKADLLSKIDEMEVLVARVEEMYPEIIAAYKEKLTAKVSEILVDKTIDENRIAQEVTIYADKICVDEEMVRLHSHIDGVRAILNEGGAVGRKLDFIIQEMNREANTTLSKSQDTEVTNIGIELKTLIEKIREQVQNLE